MSNTNDTTCVVVSIRDQKETLVLHTAEGEIHIQTRPQGSKVRVCIHAPRSVLVRRKPRAETATA